MICVKGANAPNPAARTKKAERAFALSAFFCLDVGIRTIKCSLPVAGCTNQFKNWFEP